MTDDKENARDAGLGRFRRMLMSAAFVFALLAILFAVATWQVDSPTRALGGLAAFGFGGLAVYLFWGSTRSSKDR